MEFIDLKAQYIHLKDKIDKNIEKVLDDAHYIMGEEVKELEEKLAKYVGRKYCATCANGTDALTIAMKVLDIKKGDAVFVPTFTFYSTAEVVSLEGATPIFVDVDERTFNIDVRKLDNAINQVFAEGKLNPKAIIPVDLFGQTANFPEILRIAEKYNLKVVEDGAQGFGGEINGKKACSFGDISTTSFFPAKPLGCYGDGGAIFTDDEEMYKKILSIRVHGKGSFKYENVRVGLNSRLDTIQAAILLPKLEAFEEYELEARNKFANLYTEKLKDVVKTPVVPEGYLSSWAQYTIILESEEQRNSVQEKLKELGVPRDQVVIASKVYFNEGHLSKEAIFREIEGTLSRLQTDYLDLYQIHRFDYDTPMEETMEALHELVQSGKVRAIGASAMYGYQFHNMQIIAEQNGWTKFSTMQNHYNLLYREDERELIEVCKQYNVSLIPYSPLAGGHLTHTGWESGSKRSDTDKVMRDKYDAYKENDLIIIDRVNELANKYNVSMTQIALAWHFKKGVTAPIVGATKKHHFEDAVHAVDLTLSDEDVAYLEEAYIPHAIVGAL